MANYGDSARKLHANGNSCSVSVYQAFRDVNTAGDGQRYGSTSSGNSKGYAVE